MNLSEARLGPARLSIVIPTWNEAKGIVSFLRHLRERAPAAEIILVDGESEDETARLGATLADRVLRTRRGRGHQLNCGAAIATGDLLWFLHADSRVPADAVEQMIEASLDPRFVGGCFRLRFPRPEWVYRVSDSLGNLAIDFGRIALGDHGFFCRREVFFQIGGFPEVPLMEDAEFYRALQRSGRTRQLAGTIQTSPRRYEKMGRYRTTMMYIFILALYLAGVPLSFLAKIHNRFIRRGRTSIASEAPSPLNEEYLRA